MLVSVIIDNYNYEKYIENAIKSVLNQTYQNFEIIIVDDGSSDNSKEIINEYALKYPEKIKAIFKENGGQASAFNVGVENANGEIISFLDSDDEFEENKLEEVVKAYNDGNEYIFNDHYMVFDNNANKIFEPKRYPYNGENIFLVYYISQYVGDITSTLSISKNLANKIFPIKNIEGWRIQADDVIVFSASMMTHSFFINKKLTKYRIHGKNGYHNENLKISENRKFDRLKRVSEIKSKVLKKLNIDNSFFNNGYNLFMEFKTHIFYDKRLLRLYLKVLFFEMSIPFLKKIEISYDIWKYYKKETNE
jgi:glycosyltransferase involved in cell wall biosynthesis